MKVKKLEGYAPEYPTKPGIKLAAVTAAAVLAAGMTACRPAIHGDMIADETPICTEAEPMTTGLMNFVTEEPDVQIEGDILVDETPACPDDAELIGLIMPDPASTDGD